MTTAAALNPSASARIAHEALVGRLQEAIAASTGIMAVITIEATEFPRLFARFGNERGRALLTQLAEQLGNALRPGDIAAQVGDQTFVVVIGNLKNPGHAVLAGKKLLRVCEPESPGPSSKSIRYRTRAGIALHPVHCEDPELLIQRSQVALEIAKDEDKDLAVYDDQRAGKLQVAWEMRDELADAVREGDLDVHYQPKLDLATDRVCGAEALMRWFSPVRGQVPPSAFFAVAREFELLGPMTRFVLNAAMRTAATWQRDGHDMGVAVNLPPTMLLEDGLVDMLQSLLSIWNAPAETLTLEITESAIMPDVDTSFATMKRIKELGARISIDDFGTGYSSFTYFKAIPADELKIDRTFVSGMTGNDADRHIVETIIDLAHRFNLAVVAEGIEHEATLTALRELHCDIGQGFFIARPMPQSQLDTWLDARLY